MKNENQKPIKIIQLTQSLDPDVVNGLLGLGDDGIVYVARWWPQHHWKMLFPRPYETTSGSNDNE